MPFFCFLASFSGARAYLVTCFPFPVCLFSCFQTSFLAARAYLVTCFPFPVCLFLVFRLLFLPTGHTFLLAFFFRYAFFPVFKLLFLPTEHTFLLAFFFRYAFFLFSGFFSCRQSILFCLFSSSGMPFSCFQASFLADRAYFFACFLLPVCLFSIFLLLFPVLGHTWLLTFFFRYAFFSIHFSDVFSAIFVIKINNIIIFVLFKFYLNKINSISAYFFKNKNLNTQ